MSPKTLRHVSISMAVLGVLFLAGCGPVLDPSLSPPVIDKPIHNCAETIAFSGADRDARIAVYVNGTEVTQVPIWMGWGSIKLPAALHTGNVVAAAQIVGNRISEKSRDPVTVIAIPPSLAAGGKLRARRHAPALRVPGGGPRQRRRSGRHGHAPQERLVLLHLGHDDSVHHRALRRAHSEGRRRLRRHGGAVQGPRPEERLVGEGDRGPAAPQPRHAHDRKAARGWGATPCCSPTS